MQAPRFQLAKATAITTATAKLAKDRKLAGQHTATSTKSIDNYHTTIEAMLAAYGLHVEMAPLVEQSVAALEVFPKVLLLGCWCSRKSVLYISSAVMLQLTNTAEYALLLGVCICYLQVIQETLVAMWTYNDSMAAALANNSQDNCTVAIARIP